MLNFRNFFRGEVWGGDLPPPQMMATIKLNIKEMHFQNVDHLVHTFYKKIVNTFTVERLYLTSSSCLLLFAICLAMADSKPINFEKLIKLTSCDYTFFNFFGVETARYSALIMFAHVSVSVCNGLSSIAKVAPRTATVAPLLNCNVLHVLPNFNVNFILSECTDSTDSCDNMFM